MWMKMIMAKKLGKEAREIKSEIMDQLEDAVDDYLADFQTKSKDGKALPSINEIEDLLLSLKDKTREIYLKMASESISKFDEAEVIDSKKGNSEKEG